MFHTNGFAVFDRSIQRRRHPIFRVELDIRIGKTAATVT